MLAQYEPRTELSFQSGEVLATRIDTDIFKMIGNDVPAMTPLAGQSAATTIVATGYAAATDAETKGNLITEALFKAKAALHAKNVTDEPATILDPIDFYNVVQSTNGVNSDYTSNNGGIDTGTIRQIAGFALGWSNNLDKVTNTKLIALVFTKDVAGLVKAMDITSISNFDDIKLANRLTSYYAIGMKPLNPSGMAIVNSD